MVLLTTKSELRTGTTLLQNSVKHANNAQYLVRMCLDLIRVASMIDKQHLSQNICPELLFLLLDICCFVLISYLLPLGVERNTLIYSGFHTSFRPITHKHLYIGKCS